MLRTTATCSRSLASIASASTCWLGDAALVAGAAPGRPGRSVGIVPAPKQCPGQSTASLPPGATATYIDERTLRTRTVSPHGDHRCDAIGEPWNRRWSRRGGAASEHGTVLVAAARELPAMQ